MLSLFGLSFAWIVADLWLIGFESTTINLNTKFLLPSILLRKQLCFDDEHPLQNLLLSNWVRIVVWTWRWHLFSWWPSHHVWILVWIIGSFYLISQPCTYFFVALLYCCTLFYIYCPHFFHVLLSHSISNRIANMHCMLCTQWPNLFTKLIDSLTQMRSPDSSWDNHHFCLTFCQPEHLLKMTIFSFKYFFFFTQCQLYFCDLAQFCKKFTH